MRNLAQPRRRRRLSQLRRTPTTGHHHTTMKLTNYLATLVEEADANPKPLNRVLQELKELIEGDTILFMLSFSCSPKFLPSLHTTEILLVGDSSATITLCSKSSISL